MLTSSDQETYNRLLSKIREALRDQFVGNLEKLPPLSELHYTFDQPLYGDGWHTRETDGRLYWRFTGPASTATLYFERIVASQRILSLHAFHAITPEHLDSVAVRYNGVALTPAGRSAGVLKFSIPEQALATSDHTCIEIATLQTQRPAAGDDRLLGIAFSAIHII